MKKRNIVVLLLTAAFFFFLLISTLLKHQQLASDLAKTTGDYKVLQAENRRLQSFLDYFGLRANIEREARLKLNLSKPGETTVIFVSPSPRPTVSPQPPRWRKFFWWPF